MIREEIYIDTSVIGGYLDKEFARWSKALFEEFSSGIKVTVISDLTRRELKEAPEDVQRILSLIPPDNIKDVFLSQEAIWLADTYIRRTFQMKGIL
jgi:hypothetical protein